MPACDMSASTVTRAPETGFASRLANLSVIVAGPTRGGSGEILCSTVSRDEEPVGLEQPATNKAVKQEIERIARRT